MTRAEHIINIMHEGAGGKVAGAAALGSTAYLAKKHLGKGAEKASTSGGGNVLKDQAKGVIGKWAQGSEGKSDVIKGVMDYGKRKVTGEG
jgi:hypothetical protein